MLHGFNVAKTGNIVNKILDMVSIVSNNGNMKIQILGTGCAKCKALEQQAREAVSVGSLDATIEKIVDMQDIMDLGCCSPRRLPSMGSS